MTDSIIPVGLRLFILENIDSIAELEALLPLYRERAQTWDDAAIAKRLYVNSDIVRTILAKLERLNLITCVDNQVRFDCRASADREQLIELLSYYYAITSYLSRSSCTKRQAGFHNLQMRLN